MSTDAYERSLEKIDDLYRESGTSSTVKMSNSTGVKWKNKLAIQRVEQCKKVIGRCPDLMDKEMGGKAEWLNVKAWFHPSGIWENFSISDESFAHWRPERHYDFWFQTVKIDVPSDRVSDMLKISESFAYYRPAGFFTAGCHFYPASVVSAYCAKLYAQRKLELTDTQLMYDRLIRASIMDWGKAEKMGKLDDPTTQPLMSILEEYIFSE